MVTVHCLISYHASEEGQGTGGLPEGKEFVTLGEIPADSHFCGDVLSGVLSEVGGTHSVHGGLKMMRDIIDTEEVGDSSKNKVINVLSVL